MALPFSPFGPRPVSGVGPAPFPSTGNGTSPTLPNSPNVGLLGHINNFFGQPSTNTQGWNAGTSTSNGQTTQSTTPNIPSWYSSFLGSIPGQYQQLSATLNSRANQPLYGPQQQAAFQQNLNQTQGQANRALLSSLASRGALNSEYAAQAQTGLALGGQQQLSQYLAQTPLLNAQYQQGILGQIQNAIQGQQGFTSPITAFGTTGTSNAANNVFQGGTNVGGGQVNPNVLGGVAGLGLGALLSSLGGQGNGGSFS